MSCRVVTTEEMRRLDAAAIEDFGIPALILMENAGAAVARAALECLTSRRQRAVVLCGPGNNGGDGLVAARHLAQAGIDVSVLLTRADMPGEAGVNLAICRNLGLSLQAWPADAGAGDVLDALVPGDLAIDAIFGTGLNRPPQGPAREAIASALAARARGVQILSVDLPSGIDGDTGEVLGIAVSADVTVTFACLKQGIATGPGVERAGHVQVADISIPDAAVRALPGPWTALLSEAEVSALLTPRALDFHKGNAGHVAVIAGAPGKSGAAAMAGLSALRAGAGLVTIVGRQPEVEAVQRFSPELMGDVVDGRGPLTPEDLPRLLELCAGKDALALGPGLALGERTLDVIRALIAEASIPIVLDADALNALSAADDLKEMLAQARAPVVLTPHPKEMARLARTSVSEVQAHRIDLARRFAEEHGAILVLKGARTAIADVSGEVAINPTGNPGMATAGTGDVLAGCAAALCAQPLSAWSAARVAAFAHGLAGDLMARRKGALGLTAMDVIDGLGLVWKRWKR